MTVGGGSNGPSARKADGIASTADGNATTETTAAPNLPVTAPLWYQVRAGSANQRAVAMKPSRSRVLEVHLARMTCLCTWRHINWLSHVLLGQPSLEVSCILPCIRAHRCGFCACASRGPGGAIPSSSGRRWLTTACSVCSLVRLL